MFRPCTVPRVILATGLLCGALLVSGTLQAHQDEGPIPLQEFPGDEASGSGQRDGPVDAGEVEAFLDGVMAAHLSEKRIAGATVAVVRDGEVLLLKGYGYADVDARQPVDPERTLFRIGSVTKLFTFTAVMQLVEAGSLDLDAEVNEYLDFRIPDDYPDPITVRDLLQHTVGLEEDSRHLFTDDLEGMVPLGRWLAEAPPQQVPIVEGPGEEQGHGDGPSQAHLEPTSPLPGPDEQS